MSLDDRLPFDLPPDFAERCRATNARIEAGVPMRMQDIADQLGIPFEFFAAALAVYVATVKGQIAIVDPTSLAKPN